ncbi:putative polyketide synthase [Hypoxylon fragiforme]|uniref:putative polyketide synthase n=1 Tax=Hypoxylon fragiforme TaxID=63214 RepID=UPI0020C5B812|nr:putative polyketide synthase [Hypoxylon fragiforme]KAI2607135.1 putative polyketide synthase [Hypoxylon fragiforme]
MTQDSHQTAAAAVFCPQNKPPKPDYMASIRRYVRGNPLLEPLEQAILDLPNTWSIFARVNADIANLKDGPEYVKNMHDWMVDEKVPLPIPEIMSGTLALPLLTIIQIVQYFQYLQFRGISHGQFLSEIRVGGAQGFCGGLLPAMAIAASRDEAEVVQNACKSIRIALGIGAYGELGDDEDAPGPTTLVLRTKYAGQADEMASKFPGVSYEFLHIRFLVPLKRTVQTLEKFKSFAEAEGLPVTRVNLRGRVHNPANQDLSQELCQLCTEYPELRLPNSDELQVPVRSNNTGALLSAGVPLAHEIITGTLVKRCEWFTLMGEVARDLKEQGNQENLFAMFGTGRKNCVPASPFEEVGVKMTKLDVMTTVAIGKLPGNCLPPDAYPEDAIAVVGAACRLPGANSIDELWDLISAGRSRAQELPEERLNGKLAARVALDNKRSPQDKWYGNFLDDVDSFDNAFFGVSPREALYMDPQQRLLLETAYEALDSSGYLRHHRREDFDNVGCFIGTTYTEYLENTTAYGATAYSATGTIRAFQNGKISYHFGWSGPSEAIDTACSSSLVAVHRACRAIQAGECPMALAGGVNIITGIQNFLDLGKAGFLSTTGQCKPFDQTADGYCRADGVGLVVLKSLKDAVANGDDILGVVSGIATNHGGLSSSITVPYSRAQFNLFNNVIHRSGLKPRHVSYVEAHGTGTQVGDPIEIGSIREVLGKSKRDETLYLGSLKANVGHSETAAGIGSLLKVISMLQHRELPPLAGFKSLNPKIPALEPDHLQINREILPWDAPFRAAMVNSYGAAGSNAALIYCEAPRDTRPSTSDSEMSYPVFLSAATTESLKGNATKLAEYVQKVSNGSVRSNSLTTENIAMTLHQRRKHHNVRWVGTASGLDSLAKSLETDVDHGVFDTTTCSKKSIVLTFSGQSKQNIQLDPSWYSWFPRLRFHLDHCNEIVKKLGYPSILPVLSQPEPIDDVVLLQCGTFAVQYACAMCWIDSGLEVQAVIGHSFGELTAMTVSGVLSLADGLRLVASRAALMRKKWGPERGTMLAIHATHDIVSDVISSVIGTNRNSKKRLEIACFNSPKSQVIVGSAADIDMAEKIMRRDQLFHDVQHQRVNTSHGFHSVFTEPILESLDAVARTLTFNQPTIPLETCTQYPLENTQADRVVQHTRTPVYFHDAVARLEKRLGPCIWIEAGSDSPIIPMTKKAVKDTAIHTFLSNKAKGNSNVIATTTAALWREGVAVDFWPFLSPKELGLKPVWLPPYQFQRKRHWLKWIDPATEERKALIENGSTQQQAMPPKLVTRLGTMSESWASLEFAVHTETSRFTDIVSGHAVRGWPLCPASMYMECAVMAAQMIKPEIAVKTFKFENISFQGALGLNHGRNVSLTMEGAGEYLAWSFAFSSSSKTDPKARSTTHAKGRFSVTSRTDFQLLERMMADRIQHLGTDPRAEKLNANRAYALFSRVVNYAEVLRGISHITILDSHAVAQVRRPTASVSSAETTAAKICDTVSLDTFIQVVGLLINSSDACPEGEVFIATGIDDIVMQDCDFSACDSWTVYAMSTSKGEMESAGDMLVFTGDGKLILTGSGVKFTRYPIAKLEKLLSSTSSSSSNVAKSAATKNGPSQQYVADSSKQSRDSAEKTLVATDSASAAAANHHANPKSLFGPTTTHDAGKEGHSPPTQKDFTPSGSSVDELVIVSKPSGDPTDAALAAGSRPGEKDQKAAIRIRQRVLELISENCGEPLTHIEDSASLQDVGVDSLSVIELGSSMEDSFGVQLSDDDLHVQSTILDILGYLNANASTGVAVH